MTRQSDCNTLMVSMNTVQKYWWRQKEDNLPTVTSIMPVRPNACCWIYTDWSLNAVRGASHYGGFSVVCTVVAIQSAIAYHKAKAKQRWWDDRLISPGRLLRPPQASKGKRVVFYAVAPRTRLTALAKYIIMHFTSGRWGRHIPTPLALISSFTMFI